MGEIILEMIEITKIFPGVKALDNVSLSVERGEIHALCGENGAGKSTLINILSGVYGHDTYSGKLIMDGKESKFDTIHDAEEAGVVCIHQELALVPEMSVMENVMLNNEPNRMGIINKNEAYIKTHELLERVGLLDRKTGEGVTPHMLIKDIGVGQRQLVEIAKVLSKKAKIIVFDEPTSALSETEVENLLELIMGLREEGITCIYISHKLHEVRQIADRVTVIRDGKSIVTEKMAELTIDQIINYMVGRELANLFPYEAHERGDLILDVKNYSVFDPLVPEKKIIDDVSFSVYKGEILGISGLMGAGRTELFTSLFGAFAGKAEGEVFIDGEKVNIKSPHEAIKRGLVMATEDRKKDGLVLGMNIRENTTISSLEKVSKRGIINSNEEITQTQKYIDYLKTKTASMEVRVRTLSGGNQQKVVLAKVLLTEPVILVLDEPTRGIDVGAKYEIYNIMNKLVESGVAVVMISSEMEEILGMSDHIIVLSGGKVKLDMRKEELDQETILAASAVLM